MTPRMTRLAIISAVLVAALPATPVSAQFRLPKVRNPLARATAPDPNSPKVAPVEFDDAVLEITPLRLDALRRGLAAEQAMAARVDAQDPVAIARADSVADATYQRDMARYDAAQARFDSCAAAQLAGGEAAVNALVPSSGEQARLQKVADRIKAAQARNDLQEVMRLTDSLMKRGNATAAAVTAISDDARQRTVQACGTRPVPPTRPARQGVLTYDDISTSGVQASGLTARQYRILRERVAPVLLGVAPGGLVYTRTELEAITAARGTLDPYRDIVKRF